MLVSFACFFVKQLKFVIFESVTKTNSQSPLSDAELLELLQSGKEAAFAAIYERYWSVLYAHSFKMLRHHEQARDIVQEVFTRLWMEAPHLPTTTNLGGYLFVLARNKVLNQLAQQQTRQEHLRSIARFAEEQPRTPLEQLSEKELADFVEQEIQQLPPKMKAVFELSRKQQFTHREIAETFHLSDKTVKKQIHNALKIIRLRLHARIHGLH